MLTDLHHLTWTGRAEWLWYRIRGVIRRPSAEEVRCIMGYPIGPAVRCPRRAVEGSLWCRRHTPAESGHEGSDVLPTQREH